MRAANALSNLIAVVALPFAYFLSSFPMARFEQETIIIQVHPDHVIVDGVYSYRNPFPFPIVQGLSIPLPVDGAHPAPGDLEVEELSPKRQTILLRSLWGAFRFDLPLRGNQTVCLHVHYDQQAPSSNARYILTTTQPWLRPLQAGKYRLVLHRVALLQSNYPLSQTSERMADFQETQFMPEHDWIFSWKNQ